MKLALAALVYLLIALILSVGILLTIAGKPWLLIVAFVCLRRRLCQDRLPVTTLIESAECGMRSAEC